MKSYDLSIEELEQLAIKYDLPLSDDLIGLVSDIIVMVLKEAK
jgi:hypothetical protein